MRLDVLQPSPLTRRALIVFNGRACREMVTMADEEAGIIRYYSRPLATKGDDMFDEELAVGKVKIIDPLLVDLADVYLR